MAPFTFTSRPQHTMKLPLVAVTALFTFTSRAANKLSVVGLELAVQLTASLTKISPLPGFAVLRKVTGGVPAVGGGTAPVPVLIDTLLVTSSAERVAPEMLSVAPPPITKSCGSMSQLPAVPCAEAVVMRAESFTLTCAAEVSTKPPSPPTGALAFRVPFTFVVPLPMSAKSLMVPLTFEIVWARITPVLLTTVDSRFPAP